MDEEIVRIALELRCDQVTLVPENRQEITTEGGLDTVGQRGRLEEVTRKLQQAGVIVSAFVDPELHQIEAAAEAGCDAIEIHTGAYANACLLPDAQQREVRQAKTLEEIRQALQAGLKAGLIVHGGHGLTYSNVTPVAALPGFSEFNIGHTIISRAVFVGLREAVREMKHLIVTASPKN